MKPRPFSSRERRHGSSPATGGATPSAYAIGLLGYSGDASRGCGQVCINADRDREPRSESFARRSPRALASDGRRVPSNRVPAAWDRSTRPSGRTASTRAPPVPRTARAFDPGLVARWHSNRVPQFEDTPAGVQSPMSEIAVGRSPGSSIWRSAGPVLSAHLPTVAQFAQLHEHLFRRGLVGQVRKRFPKPFHHGRAGQAKERIDLAFLRDGRHQGVVRIMGPFELARQPRRRVVVGLPVQREREVVRDVVVSRIHEGLFRQFVDTRHRR